MTFQLPFGVAGWWSGAFLCRGWESPLPLSPGREKGLNSGLWTVADPGGVQLGSVRADETKKH